MFNSNKWQLLEISETVNNMSGMATYGSALKLDYSGEEISGSPL